MVCWLTFWSGWCGGEGVMRGELQLRLLRLLFQLPRRDLDLLNLISILKRWIEKGHWLEPRRELKW